MSDPFHRLSQEKKEKLRRRDQPAFTSPMLARLAHDHFSDPSWIFERKFDGERCLAFRRGKAVELKSRNEKDLTPTYPEIAEALENGPESRWIIDGEIVAFKSSVTSFERLQKRMKVKDLKEARRMARKVAVYFYVFDILYLDGHDTTGLGLRDRKDLLRSAFNWDDPIRFTPHRNEKGEKYHEEACRRGWEGIIAEKADSAYVNGRSGNWLKFKCVHRQEFVIGGFTEPKGERVGFGALLIGYHDMGGLRYAGKVGTGYDDRTLKDLADRMRKIKVEHSPFTGSKIPEKGVTWIRPELVGEFGYTELTRENRLRHPRFLGLRRDKKPRDVKLEDKKSG